MRIFAEIDRTLNSVTEVPHKTLASKIQWDGFHKEHLPVLSTEAVLRDMLTQNEDFFLYDDKDFLRFATDDAGPVLWMVDNDRVKAYDGEFCENGVPLNGKGCQGNYSFVGEYNYNEVYPLFGIVTTGDLTRAIGKVEKGFEVMDQCFGRKTFGVLVGPFLKQSHLRKQYRGEKPWDLAQNPVKYCTKGLRDLASKFRQRLHFVDSGSFAKHTSMTMTETLEEYGVKK